MHTPSSRSHSAKINFRLALSDIFYLLNLVIAGFVSLLQDRKRPVLRLSDGVFIPKNLPTGDTLGGLEWRFQAAVKATLFGSRLAYLYAVLFDPDLILDYIDDAWLADQVVVDNLASNTALFHCVALVESAVEGRAFGDNPANTLAAYLRSEFRRRDWLWPPSPLAWKQYFLEHHVEMLFPPGYPIKT